MTGNQPGRIFLIDTASAWFAVLVFFLVNILLLVLTQTLLPNLDALYFIGFTQKAYLASIIIAPLFVFVLRRFGKTSIWDMSFWLVILTAAIMASRYGTCALRVVDDHLYTNIFDPRLSYQLQCAYFALINFVLGVPKALIAIFALGLVRGMLGWIFRVNIHPQALG